MCNVHLISSRYGNEWSGWHTISISDHAAGREETLVLASGEEITSISGYSEDIKGWTRFLQAETSLGRSWGPHGEHKPDDGYSLKSSPATNHGILRLNHISGDQTEYKYLLRWLYNEMKTLNVYSWEGCKQL